MKLLKVDTARELHTASLKREREQEKLWLQLSAATGKKREKLFREYYGKQQ